MDNSTRRILLDKVKSSGYPGSVLDVYAAYDQGIDLVQEYISQQQEAQGQLPPQQEQSPKMQQEPQAQPQAPPSSPPPPMSLPTMQEPRDTFVNSGDKTNIGIANIGETRSAEMINSPAKMQMGGSYDTNQEIAMYEWNTGRPKQYIKGGLRTKVINRYATGGGAAKWLNQYDNGGTKPCPCPPTCDCEDYLTSPKDATEFKPNTSKATPYTGDIIDNESLEKMLTLRRQYDELRRQQAEGDTSIGTASRVAGNIESYGRNFDYPLYDDVYGITKAAGKFLLQQGAEYAAGRGIGKTFDYLRSRYPGFNQFINNIPSDVKEKAKDIRTGYEMYDIASDLQDAQNEAEQSAISALKFKKHLQDLYTERHGGFDKGVMLYNDKYAPYWMEKTNPSLMEPLVFEEKKTKKPIKYTKGVFKIGGSTGWLDQYDKGGNTDECPPGQIYHPQYGCISSKGWLKNRDGSLYELKSITQATPDGKRYDYITGEYVSTVMDPLMYTSADDDAKRNSPISSEILLNKELQDIKFEKEQNEQLKKLPPSGAITPVLGPVEYALGAYTLAPIASAAAPYVGAALNTPLSIGATTIPGATLGNALTAGFGARSASMLGNDVSTGYYGSDAPLMDKLYRGLDTGLGFVGTGVYPALGKGLGAGYRGLTNIGKTYDRIATGETFLTDLGLKAWKSPAVGLSQSASDDMFRSLLNSGKLAPEERALIIEYQHNSRPFTGRDLRWTTSEQALVNAKKRQDLNNIINKYRAGIGDDVVLTRMFGDHPGALGAKLEKGRLNFGDRPTSFTAGVQPAGYARSINRVVIPRRYSKQLGDKFLVNQYDLPSEDVFRHLDDSAKDFASWLGTNSKVAQERELIGTGLDFRQIGKVKNDIGGYDLIVKPNTPK